MEQKYNDKMESVGFNQLVCDIFLNWEDVKDEILLPDRKIGSGNVYLANLHTSFLCNLIYPTFSRILLYSC